MIMSCNGYGTRDHTQNTRREGRMELYWLMLHPEGKNTSPWYKVCISPFVSHVLKGKIASESWIFTRVSDHYNQFLAGSRAKESQL